jgi:hypothetical protein
LLSIADVILRGGPVEVLEGSHHVRRLVVFEPPPGQDGVPVVENEVALVCEHHVSLPLFVDDGDHPQCLLGHPSLDEEFPLQKLVNPISAVLGRQQSGFEYTPRYVTCAALKEIDRLPQLMFYSFIHTDGLHRAAF